jgi:hypothetical protein
MNLQEAGETLESIANRFGKLLSSPTNTPSTWIEGVRTAKEAIDQAKRSLDKATEKSDYKAILGAMVKIYAGLGNLSKDQEGVPPQWQSHVGINMDDLTILMAFFRTKANK